VALRYTHAVASLLVSLALFAGCSDNGEKPPPDGGDSTGISQEYFPVRDGNFWSYDNGTVTRELSGDTIVNGVTCARLLENGKTAEAWTLTDKRFAQHLLDGDTWFDPPLQIPLNLKVDSSYAVNSFAHLIGDTAAIGSYTGTLTNRGYVTQTVGDTTYDSCLYLGYHIQVLEYVTNQTSTFDFVEYYAKGVGLILSPPDLTLDFAVIDGDTLP
jgi:hypothetical protein